MLEIRFLRFLLQSLPILLHQVSSTTCTSASFDKPGPLEFKTIDESEKCDCYWQIVDDHHYADDEIYQEIVSNNNCDQTGIINVVYTEPEENVGQGACKIYD